MAQFVTVQSIQALAGKPVAGLDVTYASGSGFVQYGVIVHPSAADEIAMHVRSLATNAAAVALTGPAGEHLTVHSVHVVNQPSVVGSVQATQAGAPWTVTGSVEARATQASSPWVVTGSVAATQGGAPWTVVGSVRAEIVQVTSPLIVQVASTVAGGTSSVWASQPATADPYRTVGSVHVSNQPTVQQGGPPWSITGSVQATQASSPWVTTGSATVTQGGAPWTVTGSVEARAVQVTSPWIVQVASTVPGSAVSSVWASQPTTAEAFRVVGSVEARATQATSPWIVQVASTVPGSAVDSVWASQPATADAYRTVGSVHVGNQPTVLQGAAPWTVTGSVEARVVQVSSPWVITGSVQVTGGTGVDSVWASQPATADAYRVVGSVQATQQSSPWVITGSATVVVGNQPTVTVGNASLPVTQASSPWVVVGSAQVVVGNTPSVLAVQANTPWIVHVASIVAGAFTTDSVWASQPATADPFRVVASVSQVSSPWIVSGSVQATAYQQSSPWVVTGSVQATAWQQSSPWVVTGSVGVTQQSSPWVVTGSVAATAFQQSSPWVVTGSVAATAFQQSSPWVVTGSVAASVVNTPSIAGIVAPLPSVAWPSSQFASVSSRLVSTSNNQLLVGGVAAGANVRYYVTAVIATVASVGTIIRIDSLWQGYCAPQGGGFAHEFHYPLRQTAVNTTLVFQCVTSGAGAQVSVVGFVAP